VTLRDFRLYQGQRANQKAAPKAMPSPMLPKTLPIMAPKAVPNTKIKPAKETDFCSVFMISPPQKVAKLL
jgi:hypothetical protein